MLRVLYRSLVWLHPKKFRREFGSEMVWIFDEASGGASMVGDAAASLVRQWVIGEAVWKFPVALLGGMLYFMLAGSLLAPHQVSRPQAAVDFGLSPMAWPDQPGR